MADETRPTRTELLAIEQAAAMVEAVVRVLELRHREPSIAVSDYIGDLREGVEVIAAYLATREDLHPELDAAETQRMFDVAARAHKNELDRMAL